MNFICLFENRTMKIVESILSREERVRENDGWDESSQVTL
jgi:hypothetical protein